MTADDFRIHRIEWLSRQACVAFVRFRYTVAYDDGLVAGRQTLHGSAFVGPDGCAQFVCDCGGNALDIETAKRECIAAVMRGDTTEEDPT